nr:hypothetical protein [Tanacetum cinerariifolium]
MLCSVLYGMVDMHDRHRDMWIDIDNMSYESAKNSDLNASLLEKVLVITALKDNLRKLKGKVVVDEVVILHTIDPELLKVDVAWYGYCKSHKKSGQKRTREWKEYAGAGNYQQKSTSIILSQLWSTL